MTALIVLLAVLAIALGLVELFLTPAFGVAGFGAIVSALACAFVVYNVYGVTWAIVTIAVSVLLLIWALRWLMHSKTMDRMSLNASIDSKNASPEQLSVRPGDSGVALTRLALIGNARIGEVVVEVKSSGAFINPGTRIKVISVNEASITVEEDKA